MQRQLTGCHLKPQRKYHYATAMKNTEIDSKTANINTKTVYPCSWRRIKNSKNHKMVILLKRC